MRGFAKRIFFIFIAPVLRLLLMFFFERKYLSGKWFDDGYLGYIWAFKSIFHNNLLRLSKPMPWPTSYKCSILNPHNIVFHPDDLNNFQSHGTYYQNYYGVIEVGRGSYIAPNVGMITSNHSLRTLDSHDDPKPVIIGKHCWVGMNSVLMPGVSLADGTIVGAGSVVTKSVVEENCVVVGAPARVVKKY